MLSPNVGTGSRIQDADDCSAAFQSDLSGEFQRDSLEGIYFGLTQL
jgi:hypothetical protein